MIGTLSGTIIEDDSDIWSEVMAEEETKQGIKKTINTQGISLRQRVNMQCSKQHTFTSLMKEAGILKTFLKFLRSLRHFIDKTYKL